MKNLLVFLPLLLAHEVTHTGRFYRAALAFVAFSLCASGVYLLNDLLDLRVDRQHPVKRQRPLAAGALDRRTGVLVLGVVLVASFWIALGALPVGFTAVLALYLALAAGYCFGLKRVFILDVLLLAGFHSLRILAGGIATAVPVSFWLVAFSTFFFLSLACMKRYSQLAALNNRGNAHIEHHAYTMDDMPWLGAIGATNGYLSVLVFVLYLDSATVTTLYEQDIWLWCVGPLLLYWITRSWLMAYRGQIGEDPVIFALKDSVSYAVGVTAVLVVILATL